MDQLLSTSDIHILEQAEKQTCKSILGSDILCDYGLFPTIISGVGAGIVVMGALRRDNLQLVMGSAVVGAGYFVSTLGGLGGAADSTVNALVGGGQTIQNIATADDNTLGELSDVKGPLGTFAGNVLGIKNGMEFAQEEIAKPAVEGFTNNAGAGLNVVYHNFPDLIPDMMQSIGSLFGQEAPTHRAQEIVVTEAPRPTIEEIVDRHPPVDDSWRNECHAPQPGCRLPVLPAPLFPNLPPAPEEETRIPAVPTRRGKKGMQGTVLLDP